MHVVSATKRRRNQIQNTTATCSQGQHQIHRRLGVQWTSTGKNQRKIGDDRVCGDNGGGAEQWSRCVRTDLQRRRGGVCGDERGVVSGVVGAVVERG
ncbi:hypothetical protein Ccrd_006284 [Cynara cardunculus var. scolymus]|uniref:Uncharacterized protein n=1 Tax=Cynara cardunculus var. scolymus TaxID=59895 RepID=A0A103XJ73_CYNCS|nr:hypothetical protein Ccrd_006284 [Cynara cardunculus var. scolymus]